MKYDLDLSEALKDENPNNTSIKDIVKSFLEEEILAEGIIITKDVDYDYDEDSDGDISCGICCLPEDSWGYENEDGDYSQSLQIKLSNSLYVSLDAFVHGYEEAEYCHSSRSFTSFKIKNYKEKTFNNENLNKEAA